MLRIFRTIRKKLIEQDNVRRYLLYALGEILLVMIGILLALQVNNWNQERQEKSEQFEFLLNLKNEFDLNSEELANRNEQHKFVFEMNTKLGQLMSPDPIIVEDALFDSLMFSLAFIPEYRPVSPFIDKIELVGDDQLKVLIAEWSVALKNYESTAKIIYDLYYNYLYPSIMGKYQMRNIPSRDWLFKFSDSEFSFNQKEILSNSTFENHVILRSYNASNIYENGLELDSIQSSIIDRITYLLEAEY